jgi:hypothetical protein
MPGIIPDSESHVCTHVAQQHCIENKDAGPDMDMLCPILAL